MSARVKQCQEVIEMGEKTNRDHEDDPNDVSLISRLRVIEKVPVDVEYCQGNGSNSA